MVFSYSQDHIFVEYKKTNGTEVELVRDFNGTICVS